MSPHELPPLVLEFLSRHLRSLEELQLLIAVMQSPDRWWDANSAARELDLRPSEARRALDHFAASNLLDIKITGDVRYQFHPGTDELRAAARAVLAAYRADPLAMVRLMTTMAKGGIHDFADAFRIWRDDDR
jgi:hypothetical protein